MKIQKTVVWNGFSFKSLDSVSHIKKDLVMK